MTNNIGFSMMEQDYNLIQTSQNKGIPVQKKAALEPLGKNRMEQALEDIRTLDEKLPWLRLLKQEKV